MKRPVSLLSLALAALAAGCDAPVATSVPAQSVSSPGGGYTYGTPQFRGYGPAPVLAPVPSQPVNPAIGGSAPPAAGITGPSNVPFTNSGRSIGAVTLAPIDTLNQLSDVYVEEAPAQVAPEAAQAVASPAAAGHVAVGQTVMGDAGAVPVPNPAMSQAVVAPTQPAQIAEPQIVYQPVYERVYVPEYYPVYIQQPAVVYVEPSYLYYPVYEPFYFGYRYEVCLGVVIHWHDDGHDGHHDHGHDGPGSHDGGHGSRPLLTVPAAPREAMTVMMAPQSKDGVHVPLNPLGGAAPKLPAVPPKVTSSGSHTLVQAPNTPNRGLPVFTSQPAAVRSNVAVSSRNEAAAAAVLSPKPGVTPAVTSPKPVATKQPVVAKQPVVTKEPVASKPPVVVVDAPAADKTRFEILPAAKATAPVIAPAPKADPVSVAADRRPAAGNAPAKMPVITPDPPVRSAAAKVDMPAPARVAPPAPVDIPAPARVAPSPRPAPVAMPEPVVRSSPSVSAPEPVRAAPTPRVSAPTPAPDPPRASQAPSKMPTFGNDKNKN